MNQKGKDLQLKATQFKGKDTMNLGMITKNLREKAYRKKEASVKDTNQKCKEKYSNMNLDWQNMPNKVETSLKFAFKQLIEKSKD